MTSEAVFGIFGMVFAVLALALGIAWLFLPWFLISKMDRMIELLEKMANQKRDT